MTDIDPIQTQINKYLASNFEKIIQNEKLNYIKAYKSLKLYLSNNRYSKYKAFELIEAEQNKLLNDLYQEINKLSTETWLMYLRRIHTLHVLPEHFRALSILLVNNRNRNRMEMEVDGFLHEFNIENHHAFIVDEDTMNKLLHLVFSVSSKIVVICSMTPVMRLIGKGMEIEEVIDGFPKFFKNDNLSRALYYYDNYCTPFAKLALPVDICIKDNMKIEKNYDCFGLAPIQKPLYITHAANDFKWAIMHYLPFTFRLNDVFKLLDKYSEGIEIIFNVSMQSIRYVIYALSKLTGDTILSLFNTITIIDNEMCSSIDLNDVDSLNITKFSSDLLNRGYLRFKKDHLINRMCGVDYEDIDNNTKINLINEFMNAFCSIKTDDIKIYSDYIPFIYLTEKDNLIIDFTTVFYFFESLFKSGKEYYATLQGDRFNAYVRQMLGSELPHNVFVYDRNRDVINNNNEKAQIDVIVNIEDTVYIIECKAFEKKANYFKGHPKEITNRINRIDNAVEQAKRSCKIAEEYFNEKFPINCNYDWIVCSTDREFIYPLDRYGFLYDETPKVCTLEEIIEFFKSKV